MEKTYNLILVDDHILIRNAFKFVLEQSTRLDAVSDSFNRDEILEILDSNKPIPDMMTISFPVFNGCSTFMDTENFYPKLNLFYFSKYGEEVSYFRLLKAKAKVFMVKEVGSEALIRAIFTVLKGESYCSDPTLCKNITDFSNKDVCRINHIKRTRLSKQEGEEFERICSWYSITETANNPGMRIRTIEGHRSDLLIMSDARY